MTAKNMTKVYNDAGDQRGMTLVELTITVVLTMTVTTGVIIFMISGIRTYSAASARANLMAQAQTAVGRISDDILLSASADVNNRIEDSNSPVAGNPLGWQSDADTLILATAAEDQSRNILFADASMYISHKNNIIYYLSNKTLYRRVLATDVTGNRAITTCPPATATASCPADGIVMEQVESFTVTYRNHLNQTVAPDSARSIEVGVVLRDKAQTNAKVSYTTRTVFRND